ncbi:MAG: RagB/SusD family nutrient uptake outer membrane protein, partial [Cyclobacteriaceae bacterium]|nr:RagB/SusD family nutrient uptake outer membrane protein [Cyclobacteriaceae bacterium HetDA_MAG_MS6]
GSNFDEGFENNAESLFEVQFSANEITLNIWLSVEGFPANGDTGGYWGLFDGTVNFGSTVVATADAIGAFEVGDPRIAESFDPATGEIFKYVNRASYSGNLVPGTPHVFNNARALRYADILLMQAWAIVETGGTLSDAIALVNQVRTRARDFGGVGNTIPADHPTTETDVNTVRDWVLNERRVELAFEESHRWFDLRLLHLTNQIDLTTYDFGDAAFADSYDFDAFEIYFPFPDQEVETTALNQNTGYN